MSVLGFAINISPSLNSTAAITVAQWIGGANVVRNQRLEETYGLPKNGDTGKLSFAYGHIKKKEGLDFLKVIPPQILRNASTDFCADVEACRKGLRKFPRKKGRNKKRSCRITSELFLIEPHVNGGSQLTIFSSAKKDRRKLFSVHLPHAPEQLNRQFRISRLGAKFTLSGSYDDGQKLPTNEQLLEELAHLSEDDLLKVIEGVDRGVAVPAYTSRGAVFTYTQDVKDKLRKLTGRRANLQRKLASKKRRNKNSNVRRCESNNQRKLADKISRINQKIADIRTNFLHHVSKDIVTSKAAVIALEDLKIRNMVKKAKPRRNGTGRKFVRNKARSKSGLNRSMHHVALGRMGDFIKYKAARYGKAFVEVNPVNTSRTCHRCKTTDTKRPRQDLFICNHCGLRMNADENASIVIAQRGVTFIKEHTFADKAKAPKKITARRKQSGERTSSLKKSGGTGNALAVPPRLRGVAGIRPSTDGNSQAPVAGSTETKVMVPIPRLPLRH